MGTAFEAVVFFLMASEFGFIFCQNDGRKAWVRAYVTRGVRIWPWKSYSLTFNLQYEDKPDLIH